MKRSRKTWINKANDANKITIDNNDEKDSDDTDTDWW